MKKTIFVVIVMAVVIGYFAMRGGFTTNEPEAATTTTSSSTSHPDPSNATFILDEEQVTLSAGKNEMPVAPGSAETEETKLLDKFGYGDLNADGKEDTVLLLARYGAGSGTFIYMAAFVSGPVTYRGSEAVFLGDRITPKSISISAGTVTVKYLDRGSNDSFATEPTIAKSKQFTYRDGKLQEK